MRKFLFLLLYGCSYSLTIQIVYNYEYPIPKQYVPKAKPEYNFEEKIEIKARNPRTLNVNVFCIRTLTRPRIPD